MVSILKRTFTLAVSCLASILVYPASSQTVPSTASHAVEQCVHWMKSMPSAPTSIDPVLFCSGLPTGERKVSGWGSALRQCRPKADDPSKLALQASRCESSGYIRPGDTLAIFYKTVTSDSANIAQQGNEAPDPSISTSVMLYTRTPAQIGDLRVPAGLMKLVPSFENEKWQFTVISEKSQFDAEESPQPIGVVRLKADSLQPAQKRNFIFHLSAFATKCSNDSSIFTIRELHMNYNDSDLFVCIRPDQIAPQSPQLSSLNIR